MKKTVCFAAIAASVLTFNSCDNTDPAQAIDVNKFFTKATVSGTAQLAGADGSFFGFVPKGTILYFSIPYESLGLPPYEGNYLDTTAVGTDGRYTKRLPTLKSGNAIEVEITAFPITAEKQQFLLSPAIVDIQSDGSPTEDLFFRLNPVGVAQSINKQEISILKK
ncbi:hypothetical protein AGMMS49982_18750 [Bacteroidia bacterium]|nr:hypothetical protein AGMMS49982_18750 [Bacteroidia bacterium]